jgi:hypothetical protein
MMAKLGTPIAKTSNKKEVNRQGQVRFSSRIAHARTSAAIAKQYSITAAAKRA